VSTPISNSLPAVGQRSLYHDYTASTWLSHLKAILAEGSLSAVFQPILNLRDGVILGYEGLVRGPANGPLHSPLSLLQVAKANNLTLELESLCCRTVMAQFIRLNLEGKLFLNLSPQVLGQVSIGGPSIVGLLNKTGLRADQIVIELTENHCPPSEYHYINAALACYRELGFQIALDDLGEGFSTLRRWSELNPDYVKLDMHFVQGIVNSPLKQIFVQAIRDIANASGAMIVAEGIETAEELELLAEFGVLCGQGYYIARPESSPMLMPGAALRQTLHSIRKRASNILC